MNDITRLEKAALITAGAGAASKALLWSLNAQVDSTETPIVVLRIIFAALSFVAFDLVIAAVVFRGWSWSGAVALLIAAAVSAAIGLDVAQARHWPILHAAPALTLAAFGAHLMLCRRSPAAPTAVADAPLEQSIAPTAAAGASATAAVQVNVAAPAALPRTIAQFIAARAAEMSGASQAQIAAELGTSADTVRRMLERAVTATTEEDISQPTRNRG